MSLCAARRDEGRRAASSPTWEDALIRRKWRLCAHGRRMDRGGRNLIHSEEMATSSQPLRTVLMLCRRLTRRRNFACSHAARLCRCSTLSQTVSRVQHRTHSRHRRPTFSVRAPRNPPHRRSSSGPFDTRYAYASRILKPHPSTSRNSAPHSLKSCLCAHSRTRRADVICATHTLKRAAPPQPRHLSRQQPRRHAPRAPPPRPTRRRVPTKRVAPSLSPLVAPLLNPPFLKSFGPP